MKTTMRKRWLFVPMPIVAVPLLLCIAVVIAFLQNCTEVHITARYGSLQFSGKNRQYTRFITSSPEECVLYLDIPDQGPISVGSLTEEHLAASCKRSERDDGNWDTNYSGLGGYFRFKEQRIVEIIFWGNLQFANEFEGQYLTLPVPSDRLHQVFGPPDDTTSQRRQIPLGHHP